MHSCTPYFLKWKPLASKLLVKIGWTPTPTLYLRLCLYVMPVMPSIY